jgi:hypothetical protein
MAGYQLPARYPWHRWKDMALVLIPVMTIMWLCTTGCMILMIPKLTTLTAMVIASLVTSTDPVLSQAIAKGPFADKYVPRALREIISAEAGANDGFGFPFLLLATYLIRHTPEDDITFKPDSPRITSRSGDVGRLGGDAGKAIETWIVEGWLYFILLGAVIGAVMGVASMSAITFTLRRFVLQITLSISRMYTDMAKQQMDRHGMSSPLPHGTRPAGIGRLRTHRNRRSPRMFLRRSRAELERKLPARNTRPPRRSELVRRRPAQLRRHHALVRIQLRSDWNHTRAPDRPRNAGLATPTHPRDPGDLQSDAEQHQNMAGSAVHGLFRADRYRSGVLH